MAFAMSSAPRTKDEQIFPGGCLSSRSSDYLVFSFLGQGSCGKVAKCLRLEDMKTVAIKMMKNEGSRVLQAEEEVTALSNLNSLDPDKCNIVRWYQAFTDRGHHCLVFEELDKSLYDFMKERCYRPLLLKEIRSIVQQLTTALVHLKDVGMIHADLKLENVMLVDHEWEPFRVKVIDFGLACNTSDARPGLYIQTRSYRSPEIILGLPFTEAIDMWSLGCIAASLLLGTPLYPGRSEYDMMRYMVETQGQPTDNLLELGKKAGRFFQRDYNSTTSIWKLKTPEQFHQETGIQSRETRRLKLSSLDDLMHIQAINTENAADKVGEMIDLLMFVDMLKRMLELDATKRIIPSQLLEHPFISMRHMDSMYSLSAHVRSCFDIMDIRQRKTLSSDRGRAVCGSLQQPSSSTSQDSSTNYIQASSSLRSHMAQPLHHRTNTHPCKSSKVKSYVGSGIKRNLAAGEDAGHHQSLTTMKDQLMTERGSGKAMQFQTPQAAAAARHRVASHQGLRGGRLGAL